MPGREWYVAGLVVIMCGLANVYGRWRRLSERPVSPRERVIVGLVAGALLFPAMVLPTILGRGPHVSRTETLKAVLGTVGLGAAPLLMYLLVTWLAQRTRAAAKPPKVRDPLE